MPGASSYAKYWDVWVVGSIREQLPEQQDHTNIAGNREDAHRHGHLLAYVDLALRNVIDCRQYLLEVVRNLVSLLLCSGRIEMRGGSGWTDEASRHR